MNDFMLMHNAFKYTFKLVFWFDDFYSTYTNFVLSRSTVLCIYKT